MKMVVEHEMKMVVEFHVQVMYSEHVSLWLHNHRQLHKYTVINNTDCKPQCTHRIRVLARVETWELCVWVWVCVSECVCVCVSNACMILWQTSVVFFLLQNLASIGRIVIIKLQKDKTSISTYTCTTTTTTTTLVLKKKYYCGVVQVHVCALYISHS